MAGAAAFGIGLFVLGPLHDVRWLVPITGTAFAGAALGWWANRGEQDRRYALLDIARISLGLGILGLAISALACAAAAVVNPLLFMLAIAVCGLCGVPGMFLSLLGLGLMLAS